jgi:DMSO/TMAO reductase YedYZ molybdopterin-dependent catalytic subunit
VKLADLAAPDPTAYQGLEGYLNGPGSDGRTAAGGWRRRGRGFLTGIVTGLLAGGVGIGVAILAAAFVRPQASPVIAIGDAVLGRASSGVKTFAIQSFGESYKLILVAAIYGVIAVLAMAIGLLARRRLAGGVTGMAALGAFGAFVALTRPESHATDVIPSLIGAAAGVAALVLLVRAGSPQVILAAAAQRARGGYRRGAEPEVVGTNRRNFLLAGVTAAGAAVAAGVAGKILGKQQAISTGGSRSAVKLPTPLEKAPALQPGAELTMPGLSPFYTPNASFYRVDTALVVPQLTTANWQLRIHGMVNKTITINFDDLMKRPQIQRDITIVCVSESVGGGYIGNARWQGARLADLLREAGVHPGAAQIVMRDTQGMAIGVSTQALMDGRDAMLAVAMNGQPLPPEHGFPVRVVVPGLYGYVSATKWVVDMELTTYAAYNAYWVKRGWSEQAEVKTESRIDTPKPGKALTAGPVVIAGVAWAQRKGIARVEVGVDGVWHEATLATQDTIDTWRQWYYRWDATPGAHTIQVRATDQTGYTQTQVVQKAEPNGATGYHTIQVNVA